MARTAFWVQQFAELPEMSEYLNRECVKDAYLNAVSGAID